MTLLPYLSVARFQGPDAGNFLHAQLSADIAALKTGEATFACYCSVRGQVFGLILVCRQADAYLVAASAELLPGILNRLKMFVLRSKLEFSSQADTRVYGIGPREEIASPGVYQPGESGLRYLFTQDSGSGEERTRDFKAREIRQQVTWLGAETTEKFIPQMLGFDQIGAVSFTKGCYPGQEIVARARYLGKVKRKPRLVLVEDNISLNPAERVELRRDGAWSNGTLIDSVQEAEGSGILCFIIAPAEPESEPDALKYQDRVYRCATT